MCSPCHKPCLQLTVIAPVMEYVCMWLMWLYNKHHVCWYLTSWMQVGGECYQVFKKCMMRCRMTCLYGEDLVCILGDVVHVFRPPPLFCCCFVLLLLKILRCYACLGLMYWTGVGWDGGWPVCRGQHRWLPWLWIFPWTVVWHRLCPAHWQLHSLWQTAKQVTRHVCMKLALGGVTNTCV